MKSLQALMKVSSSMPVMHEWQWLNSLRNRYAAPPTPQAEPSPAPDYEEVLQSHRDLVRRLDVALNGANAAQQASLCDIVSQVEAAPPAPVEAVMTWYTGAPPFPQDQEWFIAETVYGDRVVLRSLDEGREHKHAYDFKTADGTYMATRIIKRWMQFPDCEYLPPVLAAPSPTPQEAPEGLTDTRCTDCPARWPVRLTDDELMRAIINACDSLNITRVHQLGGKTRTICEDAGLLEIGRAIESATLAKTGGRHGLR